MRQVSHRETRQQGLSQDIPLKVDLYRRFKVPLSACLSWLNFLSLGRASDKADFLSRLCPEAAFRI